MNNPSLRKSAPFVLIIIALALVGVAAKASAQTSDQVTTAEIQTGPDFTFQGQLRDNGSPVNGTCDIQASLWGAETGDAQVGGTQTVNDVAVANGRFTIVLNDNSEFGEAAFTGQARWLEIAVRCPAGSGSYTTLQPRQPLTAAPYAQSLAPGAVISGSVGAPTNAMLSLGNLDPDGVGLRVFDTGKDGVFVDRAGRDGVYVGETVDDGFFVCNAGGLQADCIPSDSHNGIEVGVAADNGLLVSNAGINGIEIGHAEYSGLHVADAGSGVFIESAFTGLRVNQSDVGVEARYTGTGLKVLNAQRQGVEVTDAGENGIQVNRSKNAFWAYSPTADGLYVFSAGYNGVDVTGGNLAGYFGGAVQITGGCTGCVLANFGTNTGQTSLEPGDVVVLTGSQLSRVDSTPILLEVAQANGQGAVVGVVMGRAEEVTVENPRPDELGTRLIPRKGPAQPGEFVTIVTYGLAPVRVGAANAPLTIGQRLTAGEDGRARSMKTVQVSGVTVNEAAPTLGIALEAGDNDGDGLVWVLVNPQ